MRRAQTPTGRVTAPAKRVAAKRAAIAARAAAANASERIASECICSRLRLLNRVVSGIYDDALRPHGLELSQLSLLIAIDLLRERATGVRVAAAVQVEKSSLSRELQRLEDRAFIRRSPSEAERAVRIELTARGRGRIAAALPGWEAAQAKAAELLSRALRAAVVRDAQRVRERRLAPPARARKRGT
jgi:DNA-binding MarR family transcriptional regulator